MAERANAHSLERLVFFSDAVFAIAITLLVIEIDVPHLQGGMQEAWAALYERLPKFFAFVLSFLVIGRFWRGHHSAFGWTQHYTDGFIWPNTILLLMIAFMPFATAFMGENIGQFVPMLIYNVVLLMTALASLWVVTLALRPEYAPTVSQSQRHLMQSRGMGVVLATLCTLLLTLWAPGLSQIALITMLLWQRLALRWLERHEG
jgi:uncharacterized membrane protein